MAKLTRDDILKLARLSRLQLTDEEVESYQKELTHILDYVEKLQKVEVSGVKPTSQITGLTNVTRYDEIIDYGTTPQSLLSNAPETQDGYIKVKKVL